VSSNPVTWDIYEASHTPAKWLGTVEAATADEAIEVAAKEFGIEPKRLIAVRRGRPDRQGMVWPRLPKMGARCRGHAPVPRAITYYHSL
jgi:hypothetical protein